jgi:hypothetical protein
MGSRKIYITLIIVGAVAAVSGIFMRWSTHPSLQSAGPFVGWAGIALLLIARISFFVKRRQQPPSSRS